MKINYGIHLGKSSASIAKMEAGEPYVIKSDTMRDKLPMCVYFNKKRAVRVGDAAFNAHKIDKLKSQKSWNSSSQNSFTEFTRTLGTDKVYYSSNANKSFSSTELVTEVLKTLISFEKNVNINSAVITVPDSFKMKQIDAIRGAGKLAGLKQVEIVRESFAAALAYGLDSNKKDGFWLVFDFGGGTFDAALLKVEEGIMKVIDTEGDNYLGGKNLDFAIVDKIIIPYIQENFVIDSIIKNQEKFTAFKEMWKALAEEAKNQLSYEKEYPIVTSLYDEYGEDDEGELFEIDLTITRDQLKGVIEPIIQKAINYCKVLLKRNNLNGNSLGELILVGGPTISPIIRELLETQIKKPNTSIDPMTIVAKGAATYANTIDLSEELKSHKRDKTKIQLEIGFESMTVEDEEFVTFKILADKTEGEIPEKVFAEVTRGNKAWSSGKVEINTIGEIVEIQLSEGKTNIFEVVLFDDRGNVLESEPSSFNVIHSTRINPIRLPYNIGIEVKDKQTDKIVFRTIKGLEKDQSIPAIGTINGFKTEKTIRPGIDSDFIKIPIYEGDYASEGTRAIYNEHVTDIKISGADLPSLLPENSDINLTISVDRSEKITVTAYFPYLDFSTEIDVDSTKTSIETSWLENEIKKAKGSVEELKEDRNSDNAKLQKIEAELNELQTSFENNKNDFDAKQEVLTNLRKSLKAIEELNDTNKWSKLKQTLKEEFCLLEKKNNDLGNEKTREVVNQFRSQLDEVIQAKDVKLGNALLEEINKFFLGLNKTISKEKVEDLLFYLTENYKLSGEKFGEYYEQLSNLNDNDLNLESVYKELKTYE